MRVYCKYIIKAKYGCTTVVLMQLYNVHNGSLWVLHRQNSWKYSYIVTKSYSDYHYNDILPEGFQNYKNQRKLHIQNIYLNQTSSHNWSGSMPQRQMEEKHILL